MILLDNISFFEIAFIILFPVRPYKLLQWLFKLILYFIWIFFAKTYFQSDLVWNSVFMYKLVFLNATWIYWTEFKKIILLRLDLYLIIPLQPSHWTYNLTELAYMSVKVQCHIPLIWNVFLLDYFGKAVLVWFSWIPVCFSYWWEWKSFLKLLYLCISTSNIGWISRHTEPF